MDFRFFGRKVIAGWVAGAALFIAINTTGIASAEQRKEICSAWQSVGTNGMVQVCATAKGKTVSGRLNVNKYTPASNVTMDIRAADGKVILIRVGTTISKDNLNPGKYRVYFYPGGNLPPKTSPEVTVG